MYMKNRKTLQSVSVQRIGVRTVYTKEQAVTDVEFNSFDIISGSICTLLC
jgi:hypothetical protein